MPLSSLQRKKEGWGEWEGWLVVKDKGQSACENFLSTTGLACPGELMSSALQRAFTRGCSGIVHWMQLANFKEKLREHPASPRKKPPLIIFTDEQAPSTEKMPFWLQLPVNSALSGAGGWAWGDAESCWCEQKRCLARHCTGTECTLWSCRREEES